MLVAVSLLLVQAGLAEDPDRVTPRVVVQQAHQELRDARAADAVERFFVFGDTHRLGHAIAVVPGQSTSTVLRRRAVWARETVSVDGVVQRQTAASQVVFAAEDGGSPVALFRADATAGDAAWLAEAGRWDAVFDSW